MRLSYYTGTLKGSFRPYVRLPIAENRNRRQPEAETHLERERPDHTSHSDHGGDDLDDDDDGDIALMMKVLE